jgi:hypothetical protein
MRLHISRLAGFAMAAVFLASAGTAQAQGKGHGKEHKNADVRGDDRHNDDDRQVYQSRQGDDRHVSDSRRSDDRHVYDSRGDHDPRYDRARNGVPPGLAKKPGGMPPGQYKKLYNAHQGAYVLSDVLGRRGYSVVRSTDAGSSEYVYYRDHDGRLRRAIVSPGDGRLQFSNVPSSLLSEVLSRLY